MKKRYFKLGDFSFGVQMPTDFYIPSNFMLFEQKEESETNYDYCIKYADSFPEIKSEPIYANSELSIYKNADLEIRHLGYGYYEEKSKNEAVIYCRKDASELFKLDTVFTSLFALNVECLHFKVWCSTALF